MCNLCLVRENAQPELSKRKCATGAKRGNTRNLCLARENAQPVPSAGKRATRFHFSLNTPRLAMIASVSALGSGRLFLLQYEF